MKKSRFKTARRLLLFWTLFVAIGAFVGALGMFFDPTGKAMGMDKMLPYFQVLPFSDVLFQNYVFAGISLLIVNGVTNLLAAVLIFLKRKIGILLGGVFGVTLMLWICIQFAIFPANFMSTAFFVFGFLQAATGYAAWIFKKQEDFCVDLSNYPNIGKNKNKLVVYFSRMGYVKKQAFEEANKSGAMVYQIQADELTEGTAGFWWCGRFAMHRWPMPIKRPEIELEKFDEVTICTPIWVFSLAAPVREFCRQASGKIKNVNYIIVHNTNGKYVSVARQMDELLKIKHKNFKSIRCRAGNFKEL